MFQQSYINRFIQPDSIISQPYFSQNLNRYSYVYNSPMNYVDSSGHITGNPCRDLGICSYNYEYELIKYSDKQTIRMQNHLKEEVGEEDANSDVGIDNLQDKTGINDVSGLGQIWKNNKEEWGCGNPEIGYVDSCIGQYTKYIAFTFGTAIPNTFIGTLVGWHIVLTLDQYGEWYLGGGFDFGKNALGVNASLVAGTFAKEQLPSNKRDEQKYLENFLTENSFQYFLVPIVYFGGNYSPSIGTSAFEQGIGVPQGGAAWTYSVKISE